MVNWFKSRGTKPHKAAKAGDPADMDNTIIRTLRAGIRTRPGRRKDPVLHAYVQSPSPSVAGVRAIIAGGVAVDAVNRDGDTAFLIATRRGDESIAKALVRLGTNVYHRNHKGRTALHGAAETGSLPLVKFCLSYRAMLGAQDSNGNTPLHFAASNGHEAVVETLIRAGGHPGTPNQEGQTAFAVTNEELRQKMSSWWLQTTNRLQARKAPAAESQKKD